jgi:hypothetical protein
MSDATKSPNDHVRWTVITKMGRVVVESETAEAARFTIEALSTRSIPA